VTTPLGLRAQLDGARSAAPDQLKALLLVLVVFGHTYAEGVTDDFSKWVIYGFHMPAFLFLSGYLISAERLASRSPGQFLSHYARRMLIAWAVVSLAWLATFSADSFHSARRFIRDFVLKPEFHLWYIPALFVALLLAWALTRWRLGIAALGVIALLGYAAFESPIAGSLPFTGRWDDRYLGYLVFFVLGLAVRNGWLTVPPAWIRLVALAAGAGLYLTAFWSPGGWRESVGFLVLNLGIGLSIPGLLARLVTPLGIAGTPLQLIGEYSLWVYLLHPFITRITQLDEGPWLLRRGWGAVMTLVILIAAVLVILLWRRLPFSSAGRSRTTA